ncbi:hypothetical protein Tco_0205656 [Tanacetum coccineum]
MLNTPYPEDFYTPYPRYNNKIFWKILNVVRIMQISQGNGQNRTNTGTGTDRVQKSRKIAIKGNFMPPKPDLSFSGLKEFVNEPIVSEPTVKKPVVETSEAKASEDKPKVVRKNNCTPIIEDWVSNSEEEDVPQAKIQKKTVKPSFAKIEFVKSK